MPPINKSQINERKIWLSFTKKMGIILCPIMMFSQLSIALPLSTNINHLEKIGYSSLPGNRVQVNLDFSTIPAQPTNFFTDNPARIVLDFPATGLALNKRSQAIGIGAVQGVNAVETTDRTRVVLELVQMTPFNIEVIGNRVIVSVEGITAKQTASTSTEDPLSNSNIQALAAEPTPTFIPSGKQIENIDFRRTDKGAGRVEITLSDPNILVDMVEKGNDIILNFTDASLPEKLDRRLDVVDFATPVSFIDTSAQGNDVQMAITAEGNYEHLAYQSDNVYVVEVKEIEEEAQTTQLTKVAPKYEGQKVSFNFQNIDVRAALLLLTDLPGVNLNMVTSDQVHGNMTLRLKNVPWDQALDIILEAQGLGKREAGNVLMIDLKENIAAREKKELEALRDIKELEPIQTEFIQINYAKAKDLADLLSKQTTGDKFQTFLSDRGAVSVDERTNHLILQDTASKLAEIRQLITALDTPVQQVLIESRIVIATDDFSKSLGVKFGASGNQDLGDGYGAVVGGKVAGDTTFSGGTAFTGGQGTTGVENFLLSLPATSDAGTPAAVGLAIGKIGTYLLQLELSALQTEGRGEIISSPRVITGNQKEAVITQGTQIPYQDSAGVGTTASVQFKDATLELKVTPQITPDERIIMDLNVKKDAPGQSINGNVSIDKREVKTTVLVDNGETVVLGGVYEQTSLNTIHRVPFFSDLPLVGNLFKYRANSDKKSELLIFVTPKILKENS